MKTKTISTPIGINLYSESFGNPSNPALLLIAGAMSPARFWIDPFCQQLADAGYFVIRYDHRDTGLSSAVDYEKKPYKLNDLASDAIAVLDAYGITSAHIIGHSLGSLITQLLALDYPSRVASITLIASGVLVPDPEKTDQEKAILEKTWQVMWNKEPKPTKNYAQSIDGFLKSFEFQHGTIPMDKNITRQFVKDMYERTLPEHMALYEPSSSGVEKMHNHFRALLKKGTMMQDVADRTQDLKKIKIPVLVIHGEKDNLLFPRIAKKYCADLIPGAKMCVIPGMGHMVLNKDLFTHIGSLIVKHIHERRINHAE